MPSLSEMDAVDWLRMRLTTSMRTYEVMDALFFGWHVERAVFAPVISDLVRAGWVEDGETLSLTDDGRAHLASFS